MTGLEMETVVSYNKAEDYMTVYTADPSLINKLRKLDTYEVIDESKQDGRVIAVTFKADKKLLSFRSKRLTRNLSDEQKKEAGERMREIRERRAISSQKS